MTVVVVVVVVVVVIAPVMIVDVHLNENANVDVIDPVAPTHPPDHDHGAVPVQVHVNDHGGDYVNDHDYVNVYVTSTST